MINVRKDLSFKYVRGEGIEIGALHQSLQVPSNVTVHYVDRLEYGALLDQYPELSKEDVIRPDIIDDAYSLETIQNDSYDFCICNHVFEHMRDPIGAFINWMRILKPGGILYVSIPDAGNPLDTGRPVTTLQHMIEDYTTYDIIKERQHFFECARYWHKTSDDKANAIAESNWQRGYSIHYHVFDGTTINQILNHLFTMGVNFRILDHAENEINGVKEYIYIIEKTGYEKEISKLLENAENISFPSDSPVDVIVPIYNAYDDVCKCLISLLKYRDIYRINLINDCSTDERVDLLLRKIQNFKVSFINVIENRENQGFVRSANTGMRISTNDVILVNSDTIVTKNWAKKIRNCAYSNKIIATVTPFTNNGTICSIPEFGIDNQIPPGFTIDSFGNFIENLSFRQYPEIPTAVGFCMYIKREILQKIGYFDEASFDKGYCEENDFCLRAKKAGFSNQLCDNTFVYHKGECSFTQSKKERLEKNMDILLNRYPDYLPMIKEYCELNPLLDQQLYFKARLDTWNTDRKKKRILYILHSLGGGTEKHVEDLIDSLHKKYVFFIAKVIDNAIIFTEIGNGNQIKYHFPMKIFEPHTINNEEYTTIMKKFINTNRIDLIHVHHLMGHSFDIFQIAEELNVPVLYTLHDFFCICPRVNLINEKGKYCNAPEIADCNICLSTVFNYPENFVSSWRSYFHKGFDKCTRIVAPSNSSRDIVLHYYPEIRQKTVVIEHGHDLKKMGSIVEEHREENNGIFHIAYIGNLAPHKGRDLFLNLAKSEELSGITKWSIIGLSDKIKEPGYSPEHNINLLGSYSDFNHLRELIRSNKIDLVLLPAIWPETFSFTLSEAWCLGIPVLGSNLGAIQERISKTDGGWTVDTSDIKAVISKIRYIMNSPHDYQTVRENIRKIHLVSKDTAADQYNHLYQKNINNNMQDSVPKFDNVELYKAIITNESIVNPPREPHDIIIPNTTPRYLFHRLLLCLKENGIRYTIKRVWIYGFKSENNHSNS
jgi:GT2 family glycosyltransferase/glycosyltransferase involved in cell wall biosynthesis/SAM-dependent methyltransferase